MTWFETRRSGRGGTSWRAALLLGAALPLLAPAIAAAAADQTPADQVSAVEVIAISPLPGTGLTKNKVAGPVQVFSGKKIEDSNALDLSRFLQREANGVYANDVQNNPVQPDINYRGYTASPLLGTPQGLSVYMDGARLNQAFGDVVSWDLIPRMAIDQTTLIPGSNPVFGLNTLGGALAITTKSGLTSPGTDFNIAEGDHGGRRGEIETGGSSANGFNWYANYDRFYDDGWRQASPSDVNQGFAKLGWSDADNTLALSYSGATSDLTGNGLQDERLLAADRTSIYTKPDNTRNQAGLFNLTGSHAASDTVKVSGNAFYRSIETNTLNGDLNDDALGENLYQGACVAPGTSSACLGRQRVNTAGIPGYSGIPLIAPAETIASTPFPFIACVAASTLPVPATPGASGHGEPYEKCDGLINRSSDNQNDMGGSGQLTVTAPLLGRANTFVAGTAFSRNTARFTQTTQYAFLTPDRGVIGATGPLKFADGSLEDDDGELQDNRVAMRGETTSFSLYSSDTVELAPGLNLTGAARYDKTDISNLDFITPSGAGSVTGDHNYNRINPAVSLTWQVNSGLNVYAGYSEASRAPTSIELGCSDPANPCRLPNALAGDPDLDQVVAKTYEAGLRGGLMSLNWSLDAFRSDNEHDILFVADDPSGNGYFKNFGRTRRQGASVGVSAGFGPFSVGVNYNYLEATYQSPDTIGAEGNSTSQVTVCAPDPAPATTCHEVTYTGMGQEGTIAISPGDRIPLQPKTVIKANIDWAVNDRISLGADLFSVGESFVRGNENNQHQADGAFYLGSGKLKGYTVVNLNASYSPYRQTKVFVEVNNLFDTEYNTAGQLGFTGFNAAGAPDFRHFAAPAASTGLDERPQQGVTFYSPGEPRTIWVGLKVSLQ